ncbi:MAG: hypothetical protein H0U76_14490 [Ktedonobacteraceae bacterium]|nr:hypothetical protein [Ktedonobacteraceae bacterium]
MGLFTSKAIEEERARRAADTRVFFSPDRAIRKLQMKRKPGQEDQEESEHEGDGKAAKSGKKRQ